MYMDYIGGRRGFGRRAEGVLITCIAGGRVHLQAVIEGVRARGL